MPSGWLIEYSLTKRISILFWNDAFPRNIMVRYVYSCRIQQHVIEQIDICLSDPVEQRGSKDFWYRAEVMGICYSHISAVTRNLGWLEYNPSRLQSAFAFKILQAIPRLTVCTSYWLQFLGFRAPHNGRFKSTDLGYLPENCPHLVQESPNVNLFNRITGSI